jgi:integration host factor subunit beta
MMTKSELMAALSSKENLTEKQAMECVQLIFNGFAEALKRGERIEIRGLGSFAIREYDAYKGRNPKTGASTNVMAKKLPFFKVGKELKTRVNS